MTSACYTLTWARILLPTVAAATFILFTIAVSQSSTPLQFSYLQEKFSKLHEHLLSDRQTVNAVDEYDAINKAALSQKQEPLIVHYVWFHANANQPQAFCFLDCMSVLSVMKFLKPDAIHLHTNLPDFWPFDPCNELISNWTGVKLVNTRRRFVVGGKRIKRIEHEADVLKLELMRDVGGVALDFDVFMVNGTKLRELLTINPCVVCTENEPKLNAGFLACRKGAAYPQMILQKSYAEDFQPDLWIWNSGEVPHRLLAKHNTTAFVAQDICNSPDWIHRDEFLSSSVRKFDWRNRIAHHSYLHDRGYTRETLKTANNSMADFLKWVLTADPIDAWDNKIYMVESIFGMTWTCNIASK